MTSLDYKIQSPSVQMSQEMNLPHICTGRQYKVEECCFRDVERLKRAMESLAEMVHTHKKASIAEMGWVE